MFRVVLVCVAAALLSAKSDQPIRYDRAAAVQVSGRIQEVREVAAPEEVSGIHIVVGTSDVYVAPVRFYKDLGITLSRGQEVRVKGAKARVGGGEVILAREIRWNTSDTLTLRDADGKPVW